MNILFGIQAGLIYILKACNADHGLNNDASFISRLANTDKIDRPIYGLSAHCLYMSPDSHMKIVWMFGIWIPTL